MGTLLSARHRPVVSVAKQGGIMSGAGPNWVVVSVKGCGERRQFSGSHKLQKFAGEPGHRKVAVVISRFLFGWIALNAKGGVRAAVKDRNHCRRNAGHPAIDRSDDQHRPIFVALPSPVLS